MRRSLQIRIAFMGAFALIAMQGCEDYTFQHCVDEDGVVVADINCESDVDPSRMMSGHPRLYYRWWYGGHTPQGARVSGGSYTAPSPGSTSVHRASGVTRSVFGSRGGSSHGSGFGHGASS